MEQKNKKFCMHLTSYNLKKILMCVFFCFLYLTRKNISIPLSLGVNVFNCIKLILNLYLFKHVEEVTSKPYKSKSFSFTSHHFDKASQQIFKPSFVLWSLSIISMVRGCPLLVRVSVKKLPT